MKKGQPQQPTMSRLDESKIINISQEQQNVCVEWAENVSLTPSQTIKSLSAEIILCSIEVGKNLIAIGNK